MFSPRDITLEDRKTIESYIGKTENSTLQFTTLFIWGTGGRIRFDVRADCLVLFFYGKHGVSCTYPKGMGDRRAVAQNVYQFMCEQEGTPRFILMSKEEAKECEQLFGEKMIVRSDPNNADYVYETESLISLKGKKLHQKRNHFNAFVQNNNFAYERLTAQNRDECVELFENWLHVVKENNAAYSVEATMCLLNHMDKLDVIFGGIRVDGKLVAFSAGEAVTEDMAVIHMEYGDKEIRGIFNAMNQQFVLHEWSKYPLINREEDMGIPGLRRAKKAYRPIRMVEKYIAEEKTV